MKTAALIPARRGSKGVVNKNFRELKGKPLYEWTLEAAVKSKLFDNIILSSDGGFSDVSYADPVIVDNERPAELSDDIANLDNLLCYYANQYPDVLRWCLLQPTSPLRTYKDIEKAHKLIDTPNRDGSVKYDSVVSVTPGTCMYWVKDAVEAHGKPQHVALYHYHLRPNRQERVKKWFQENGAIYFTNRYVLEQTGVRLGGQIGLYVMPKERSFEIDDEIDWRICEMMVK